MGRKKKTDTPVEEPEVMIEPKPAEEKPAEPEPPAQAAPPQTAYERALSIREDIKKTMMAAPKRDDATTMPAIVNLRGRRGDFHFIMPQFNAIAVKMLWEKYKTIVEPEQFVNYLYTTMGFNPPKLYMYMNIINIS